VGVLWSRRVVIDWIWGTAHDEPWPYRTPPGKQKRTEIRNPECGRSKVVPPLPPPTAIVRWWLSVNGNSKFEALRLRSTSVYSGAPGCCTTRTTVTCIVRRQGTCNGYRDVMLPYTLTQCPAAVRMRARRDLTWFASLLFALIQRASHRLIALFRLSKSHTHNFIHLLKRQHNYTQKNESENLTNQQHETLKNAN